MGEEWVYVDLGADCEFDRVALYWIRAAAEGASRSPTTRATWRELQALPSPGAASDDIKLATARARALCARADDAAGLARTVTF